MLSPKQLTALFLFCSIAYFPYFLTPTVGGFDSYHYLSALSVPESAFLWVKVATFCALFASTVFIALLGKVFWQNGWLAGIFVFASPIWLMEFWKFENDQLVFPILFAALWLFFKKRHWLALALLIPAAILWKGSALYLIAFGLNWTWLWLAPIPAIAHWPGGLLPNLKVQENFPVFGALYQAFLLMGIWHIPKKALRPALFFLAIAFINTKFAIHASPLLAVGMVGAFNTKNVSTKAVAIAGPIIILALMTSMVFAYPPTVEEATAVKLAVREANGGKIYNDWSLGHLVEYYGGVPYAKSGGEWPDVNCTGCVKLTRRELEKPCTCINCPARLAVYRC